MPRIIADLPAERERRAAQRNPEEQPAFVAGSPPAVYLLPWEIGVNWFGPLVPFGEPLGVLLGALEDVLFTDADERDKTPEQVAAEREAAEAAGLDGMLRVVAGWPDLPGDVVKALEVVGRRVLGDAGFEAFWGDGPSFPEVVFFVRKVLGEYGVNLGEVPASSISSPADGTTSTPISGTTTASISGTSGGTSPIPGSSEPAG